MGKVIERVRKRQDSVFAKTQNMQGYHRQLDVLFEKVYFHEIDGRDKVLQRLQMPLVASIALAGLIGTMLQNVTSGNTSWFVLIFYVLISIAICFLIAVGYFFVKASIGKTYSYLPVPKSWLEYQKECEELYADFDKRDELVASAVEKSLNATYIQCATKNGTINAEKASYIFRILRCLISSTIFTFLAYSLFFLCALDKNVVRGTQRIEIINSIHIKGEHMSTQHIPPPPPPPPAREIREDRPTPNDRPPRTPHSVPAAPTRRPE